MIRSAAFALALLCLAAGSASAQTFGPATPGLCFVAKERVLSTSKAGAAANQRLAFFAEKIAEGLASERAAIAADANVLQIQKPVISEAVYQQRAGALALREQSFNTLENTRNDQLTRTRALVTARLIREMAPVLAIVLSQHRCAAVLESSGAYIVRPDMDLTGEIIGLMDLRLPPFNFDLESAK